MRFQPMHSQNGEGFKRDFGLSSLRGSIAGAQAGGMSILVYPKNKVLSKQKPYDTFSRESFMPLSVMYRWFRFKRNDLQ
jgi:hypothetical protein